MAVLLSVGRDGWRWRLSVDRVFSAASRLAPELGTLPRILPTRAGRNNSRTHGLPPHPQRNTLPGEGGGELP